MEVMGFSLFFFIGYIFKSVRKNWKINGKG